MPDLLPGTEVTARGLRWELVYTQNLGSQILHRLRGIEGSFGGEEFDLLAPFDEITPVARALRPEKSAPLPNWLAYHQAFLLEQAFGMDALSAVQPGRLRIEPYQLVPISRLTCNHAGYAQLWREQLGEAWREAGTAFIWTVLSGDDARWAVRAALDVVEVHTYDLTRDQYAHVLSTFSHSSYKDAPCQCLAAFDELQSLGLAAFTQKHDPYWDIPLNEALPRPVIDLLIPAAAPDEGPRPRTGELFAFQTTPTPGGSGALFAEQSVVRKRKKGTKA